ncbi:MAG: CHAD domain-containing protein, partial [Bdellovibrio sp.]|nr:CHAD domain-containing protein [Bdellovibrio sp.]
MKSQKPLSENLGKCWKNYTHLVHRSREKLSPKNIHQLRIATQRLEAVLSLVHSLKDVKYENQITDLLKKVRKSLGPLRDSQVESPLLNRIVDEKSKDKESKKLVKFFRHDKRGAEKKAHRALLNVHL